ncbi:hypothetical protein LY76DRAFT_598493 [Colletotrichum caudatum]|nr:hypothetical protein LY76DRAFT_598493 [Colletotrichum caudatum]
MPPDVDFSGTRRNANLFTLLLKPVLYIVLTPCFPFKHFVDQTVVVLRETVAQRTTKPSLAVITSEPIPSLEFRAMAFTVERRPPLS